VWEVLEVTKGEERCPNCGNWTKFEAVTQDGRPLLVFGEKPEAA
jgi:hypothetical protein